MLYEEMLKYDSDGVEVNVEGYHVEIDKNVTDMMLSESCTYMKDFTFNEEGKIVKVNFECVDISK